MDINPPKQLIKFLFPFMHMDKFLSDEWSGGCDIGNEFVYNVLTCEITQWEGDIDLSFPESQCYSFNFYFYGSPRTEFLQKFVYPAVDFYKTHSELKVNTGGGQFVIEPFHKHHINQLPMGRLISQTDDCVSTTFGECVDLCQSEYTVEKCKCYPWNLHYLHTQSDIAICSPGLREQKALCLSKCEQLSAHPCDRVMYRPEIVNKPIT